MQSRQRFMQAVVGLKSLLMSLSTGFHKGLIMDPLIDLDIINFYHYMLCKLLSCYNFSYIFYISK